MIVVANRIQVASGYEADFEQRFANRLGKVERFPGFIRNELLRPLRGDYYVVLTHWESQEAFEAWTKSDSFKQAHAGPRPPKEMYAGPNVFEMHEVIQLSEKPTA
ncbi:MAG: antibiotic biosynthesis monooxygenase [Candidatus Tectomicrobia bacterium]|nr:antibiotic biosynthesis monooxygenase [Candidatus Tectomicrobia bacterium]